MSRLIICFDHWSNFDEWEYLLGKAENAEIGTYRDESQMKILEFNFTWNIQEDIFISYLDT